MEDRDSKPNTLWVVTELYYPEETSTGYYLTRIAEGLTGRFKVKVICGQPNYFARGTKAPVHEMHNGVEIFRSAGTTLDKNVIPFRVVNMLTLGTAAFISAVRRFRRGDRVLVVTNPPALPFMVAVASLAKGAAYTLLIHDNYPEILIAAGKLRSSSVLVSAMQYFNRWLYKNASKIIVVGRDMFELLRRKTEGLDIPIDIIPNWAELERVEPAPRTENSLLKELNLSEKYVVLYAGNMGPPNDVESIVEAAESLAADPEVHFVFVGTGAKRAKLEQEVRRRDLSNVTLLDPMPRSEQRVFLNACDVSLVSLVDNMLGVSVPSRTYNLLAAGKPIIGITHSDSEVARVITEEEVGWVVPPGDAGRLSDAIQESMKAGSEIRERMGKRARRAAEVKYSLEKAMESYQAAIT